MVTPNRKLLMQSPTDPAKWEALEILANDPTNFYRTELNTAGAERYGREGGFSIVPSRDYNAALAEVSEARRAKAAPPPQPQEFAMPRNAAESVARLRQQGGYAPVGPAMIQQDADEEAMLLGRRVPGFRKPSAEMLASVDRDQEQFQQGLRLLPEGRTARSEGARPTITIGRPGEGGVARSPAQLRPPTGLRPTSDQSEAAPEGVMTHTATPTRDDEFAAALEDANNRGLSAGISRAGARFNQALSGASADTAYYDRLAQEADSPVRQLLAQREADKRRALEDPTSEQSQRLQSYVSKALPGIYTQDEISQMTAGDADAVTRYGEMRQRLDQRAADIERQRTAAEAEVTAREDEQTFRATEAQKDRDLQRELARRRGGGGGASPAQTAAAEARLERDVQNAGEALEGAGTLSSDLDFLDQMAAREDIPGVGRFDSRKTGALSFLASDDDTRTMQTMRSVVGRLLKERSGTAASDAEVERVMTELGMGPGSSEQEFRVGLKRLRQDVGNALATKQARYRPEVIQTYRERGGKTAQDVAPRAAGTPASQSDMVRMVAPNGQERLVPRARVPDAIAAGGRVVNG